MAAYSAKNEARNNLRTYSENITGAPNENIVKNHLNIALLKVF